MVFYKTNMSDVSDVSPLRGLYGACPYTPVCFELDKFTKKRTIGCIGVAVPDCVADHNGTAGLYRVFQLHTKKLATGEAIMVDGNPACCTPSFQCGMSRLKPMSVHVWDTAAKKRVAKDKLTANEVQGIAVVPASRSLWRAAARLFSYIVQRLEKTTVHCTWCQQSFRMCVVMRPKEARLSGMVTFNQLERRRFIETQRHKGIKTFDIFDYNNYVRSCVSRSWWVRYVVPFEEHSENTKKCPRTGCSGLVQHKCVCCNRNYQACTRDQCAWQRTKVQFWKNQSKKPK